MSYRDLISSIAKGGGMALTTGFLVKFDFDDPAGVKTVLENDLKYNAGFDYAEQYVDEVNQSESMDSAINGLLQSLDPYSAYMSPEIFEEMQTETSGEFGGLGIEVSMESGVVKVISPIDDTPASRAGIKAGDYIVKINDTQVQGKSLTEAVELMRGPVGSSIELSLIHI